MTPRQRKAYFPHQVQSHTRMIGGRAIDANMDWMGLILVFFVFLRADRITDTIRSLFNGVL